MSERPIAGELLALLRCPEDGGTLEARGAGLGCRSCDASYKIVDGIPHLLPLALERALAGRDGDAATGLQASEARARDDESERYDELYSDAEYRHELRTYVRLLDPRPGDVILDVGAGTGRVVKEYAGQAARVVAADFSHRSLAYLRRREDLGPRLPHAVLCDGAALPFADCSFDRVVSLSLLCFLPSEDLRQRFLVHLARVLKPGGTLIISTYHYALVKRLWATLGRTEGALREGTHSGGRIHYRNETRAEFVAAIGRVFQVEAVRGVCHRVPLVSNLSPSVSRVLDGLLGWVGRPALGFATELVARCTRRA